MFITNGDDSYYKVRQFYFTVRQVLQREEPVVQR